MAKEKEISEETRNDITNLQNIQRQLQIVSVQKQRFEMEVTQANAAIAELENAEGKAYKAVGAFLLESKPKELIKDLNDKRKEFNESIETLKTQETTFQKKATDLQKKIQKDME